MKAPPSILVGVTGSIAAYKACEIVSRLRGLGAEVTVVMTTAAQEFVGPATFRALSRNQVVTHMFIENERYNPLHVSLAEKADLLLIAPATANVIGKLASGIADDILSCLALACRCPVLIAPAMNDAMYAHPVVQRNVRTLKAIGYQFVGPVKGRLASGKIGLGRMEDVDVIVEAAWKALKRKK
ncbi:MAG: phosphopantothenoylcysteine decarboxylase [Planctomycetes bacterium]|nr:phosphopantothenoylcysteine decarboxylase [Planctomycetota bacterium]MBM4080429.1 phosphopantothenoylcysteine decarboxylase [Planctomycetota bacterium]MBM4083622.1 phosphopantothenoylcysteine decarboxylase [Planctomycetota bacterium]